MLALTIKPATVSRIKQRGSKMEIEEKVWGEIGSAEFIMTSEDTVRIIIDGKVVTIEAVGRQNGTAFLHYEVEESL